MRVFGFVFEITKYDLNSPGGKMNKNHKITVICTIVLFLSLSACGNGLSIQLPLIPTSTNTVIPPTATSTITRIPPTPTIEAIPGSNEPMVIGNFELSITTVDISETGLYGLVPADMTADETVLTIEVDLLSGDLDELSNLEIWVVDDQGNRTDYGPILTVAEKKQVSWLFPVPKTSNSFFLYFPGGEVIDLAPLLSSAEVPLLPTASAAENANIGDQAEILEESGLMYAGGTDYGGCSSSCSVYEDTGLGLVVNVYENGTMVFSVDFSSEFDATVQSTVLSNLLVQFYGNDVNSWVNDKNETVLNGTAQDGVVGNFSIYMEYYFDYLLVIAITPIN